MVVGNTFWHLHPELETGFGYYPNNAAGFTAASPMLLNYDQWYSIVLEINCSTITTGHLKLYINGTIIMSLTAIKTFGTSPMNVESSSYTGTLAQPQYNAPVHKRAMAGWIITDDFSLLQSRGYFSDPSIVATSLVVGRRRLII